MNKPQLIYLLMEKFSVINRKQMEDSGLIRDKINYYEKRDKYLSFLKDKSDSELLKML
jgi:hypothetical protein